MNNTSHEGKGHTSEEETVEDTEVWTEVIKLSKLNDVSEWLKV